MRKRIERSAIEMIEFFEEIGWEITGRERKLIKSADYINQYRDFYKDTEFANETAKKVINFFYEPEPMPFGVFWDNFNRDYIQVGYMTINPKYQHNSTCKYIKYSKGRYVNPWENFKEIKDIEELKEFCK